MARERIKRPVNRSRGFDFLKEKEIKEPNMGEVAGRAIETEVDLEFARNLEILNQVRPHFESASATVREKLLRAVECAAEIRKFKINL